MNTKFDSIKPDSSKNGFWDILSIGKKKEETGWLDIGISSAVFGALVNTFSIFSPVTIAGFYGISILCVSMGILEKNNSKTDELFRNLPELKNTDGKMPKKISKKNTEYGYALRFNIPTGKSLKNFVKYKEEFETFYKHRVIVEYDKGKNALLKIYEKDLEKKYDFKLIETEKTLEVCIGYTFGNIPVIVDIAKFPHLLIAGATGNGKTVFVRSILTSLILLKNPDLLHLHLVDLKNGSELGAFENFEMVKSFSTTAEETEKLLDTMLKETLRRHKLFKVKKVNDFTSYNKRFKNEPLTNELVVIEEYADLIGSKKCQKIVDTLTQKARSAGIHVIVSCQRPDAEVLNGRIKNNIPTVLGLACANATSSQVVFGRAGLEQLQKASGHAIIRDGVKEIELRGFFISDSKARKLLKKHVDRKNKRKEEAKFKPTEKKKIENFDFLDKL